MLRSCMYVFTYLSEAKTLAGNILAQRSQYLLEQHAAAVKLVRYRKNYRAVGIVRDLLEDCRGAISAHTTVTRMNVY